MPYLLIGLVIFQANYLIANSDRPSSLFHKLRTS